MYGITSNAARARHKHSRGFRGSMRYFALLLVLPTLVIQAASTTSAGAVVVAGFEIDGNTPDDAVAGIDWGTPAGTHATDPVGNADTTQLHGRVQGVRAPDHLGARDGRRTDQDDISDVYFHDAIVGGDIWGFVGFRRFTTSGTTNFDVEFNKLANAAGQRLGAVPLRSATCMVRFEQDGNDCLRPHRGLVLDAQSASPTGAPAASRCPATPRHPAGARPASRSVPLHRRDR